MQYALMEMRTGDCILIDATELQALKAGLALVEDELIDGFPETYNRVVYGAFIPQHGVTVEDSRDYMDKYKDCCLGHVTDGRCRHIHLIDLMRLPFPVHGSRTGFAALIATDIEFEDYKNRAVTGFIRYDGMSPEDNVLNRPGVYAFQAVERRFRETPLLGNWREFIDEQRAYRIARRVG